MAGGWGGKKPRSLYLGLWVGAAKYLERDMGTFGSGVQLDYGGNYTVYTFVKTHHTVHTGTINTA